MTLEHTFGYGVIAVTSTLIFFFAVKKLSLQPNLLQQAFREFAECIGASIVFFFLNVTIGFVGVFLVRGVWRFLGLYILSGFMLVIFSLLQGFLFQMWWRRARSPAA
jgi:hypothetical protein